MSKRNVNSGAWKGWKNGNIEHSGIQDHQTILLLRLCGKGNSGHAGNTQDNSQQDKTKGIGKIEGSTSKLGYTFMYGWYKLFQ